jgi:hypothetical protein
VKFLSVVSIQILSLKNANPSFYKIHVETITFHCLPSSRYILPLPLRFFPQEPHIPHIMISKTSTLYSSSFLRQRESKSTNLAGKGTKEHSLLPSNTIILKTMRLNFLNFFPHILILMSRHSSIEVLKKEFFFPLPFFGLPRGSFSVILEKYSQGTLGVIVTWLDINLKKL